MESELPNTAMEKDKFLDNSNSNNEDNNDDNDNKVLLHRRTSDEACIAMVNSDNNNVVENNRLDCDTVGTAAAECADAVSRTVTDDITTNNVPAASSSPISSVTSVTEPILFSLSSETVVTSSQKVPEESLLPTTVVSANSLSPILSTSTDQSCLSSATEPYLVEVICLPITSV